MTNKKVNIWIWIHNGKILKAISHPNEGIFAIYDECDNLLIKRSGLTVAQLKKIEVTLSKSGVKKVDGHREPFTYL